MEPPQGTALTALIQWLPHCAIGPVRGRVPLTRPPSATQRELMRHVPLALDSFQAGELDVVEVDEVILQHSRATKELWTFCNIGNVEYTAQIVEDEHPVDWWEREARGRR